MIAQTGIESASATPASQAAAASNAVWWLLPLAIACLGLIWYLRRLNNVTSQASVGKDSKKSSSTKANVELSVESNTFKTVDSNRQFKSSKASSKKKKKAQVSNQQNAKNQKAKPGDATVVTKSLAEPNVSNQQVSNSRTSIAEFSETASPVEAQSPSQPSVPVVAIFEPLRSVSPPRRKFSSNAASPTEDMQRKSVSEESTSRQPSGGKFERMVPSTAYTRAAASRWPASMTNTIERTVSTRAVEVTSEPAFTVIPALKVASPDKVVPAAKGLTSFVSKLKSSSSADSVSEGTGSEAMSAIEESQ